MCTYEFDVIVIGTGVAGQTVAEELAEAGKRVAVVDRREFGGTCSLRGCEPKKVMFSVVDAVHRAAGELGNGLEGEVSVDWPALIAFKRTFTDPASSAVESAITSFGAHALRGAARFRDGDSLEIDGVCHTAEHFVIATGAIPMPLGIPGADLVLTSEEFMASETIGRRVVFIGGGYISFEFAHMAAAAGSQVTILHRGGQVLGGFDPQLADMLAHSYRVAGIDVRIDSPVVGVEADGATLEVVLGDGTRIPCDMVVHGAGRIPDLDALDLAAAGVSFSRRGVDVDTHMRSVANPRVWAAGDAAALGPPLTPVGIAQARVIVRNILGDETATYAPVVVPSIVFADPPLASVGLTAEQATDRGLDAEAKFSDTSDWVSSRRMGVHVGGARVIVDNETGRILGAHLLGPHADEMINVFAAAIAGGLTVHQVRAIPWGYPTASSEIVYLV